MKVPRFDDARILVVGDAMLDRYWHGDARRVSSEAPIPVVDISEIEDRPGGAANVALNIVTLGAQATLIAVIGNDEAGNILKSKLRAAGITCRLVEIEKFNTTTKLRIVSRNQQLIRADFEDIIDIDSARITPHVVSSLEDVDSVVLSDYDKGVLSDVQPIIKAAAAENKPVMVDPKFKELSTYRGATIIKPNLGELEHAIGRWSSETEMVSRCQQVIKDLGIEAMLVTRSSEGMTLIRKDSEEVHFPARTREVYDVSGAGDTVISTLAAALAAGETLLDATGLANVAAGLVVGHFGITSVSGPELRLEVANELGFDKGIMSADQLRIATQEARSREQKIVFTNGCFDILHAGHVDFLVEAKAQGDLLIVAVNGDNSVHRLKGEGRPINPIERRMTMLAGLEVVDWVVAFEEDTPRKLLELLKPDVLVKGGDYSVEQVVGAEIVKAYAGEVKVLKLIEDCSTSALVQKIREL
ncbi:MAG: bifunctional D-glycero-beta-D-manno-heptose-7-phosphate kinase/D-glycero-beta-D-manno-heptose 1-phosphate adenylyltransferase HldE [Gammaproteobacteria bacterium]|nr:bifunctional D-glycero-beta-D-manno-heptose-7-phosphate kinase/D-glycero-beta-D-manno-heptose 1-phosphate adenylyltransferase HldE [Gammaproteobacteria bacterium]